MSVAQRTFDQVPRPILLGIVGDSASGKTTLTRGLVRVLGDSAVSHFCAATIAASGQSSASPRSIRPVITSTSSPSTCATFVPTSQC